MQSVKYCFTDNENRTPEWNEEEMVYLVYQTETAPSTGHLHTQGFCRFKNRVRLAAAQRLLGLDRAHFELAKGTDQNNKDYCTKLETRAEGPHGEYGKLVVSEQGKRSDLQEVADKIKQGACMREVALDHPATFIKYHGGMVELAMRIAPPPPVRREVQVFVLWGPTGTGKTHRVRTTWPECYTVTSGDPHPWDGYEGQKVLFLDEFNSNQWKLPHLNQLLDVWAVTLPARYHSKTAAWNVVVIASNTDPWTWFLDSVPPVTGALIDAGRRRYITQANVTEVLSREQEVELISAPQSPQLLPTPN